MAKSNDPPDPPVDPPTPPADPPVAPAQPPAAPTDDEAKHKERIKGVLAELAASGEIFGGDSGDKSGPDLETAVARILERRETESKAREQEQEREQTLTDLKEKVGKGLTRVRRWFEPASPWGD